VNTDTGTSEALETVATQPKRKGTLLIVDDEDGPRQSLEIIFKEEYAVLSALDGPAAVGLAKQQRVDVALVDVRMAGMSGIEVLERLKYVDPEMEVIMMTAFETTDTIRQALRLRAADYINKPFDLATIRSAVSEAMQRRNLESEIHGDAEKLQQLFSELQNQKIEEQISKNRGEIYASILHDLNGPLTVISGFVQLMNHRIGNSTRLEAEDLTFIKDQLNTITRQVGNCLQISRRYLSFLKRQPEEFQKTGVNQLLSDFSQVIRVHPSVQENQYDVRQLPENVAVRMNGTDVIQALLNLTVNAFQSTPLPHTVQIEAEVLEQPLDLEKFKDTAQERLLNVENFQNGAPMVRLIVRDDGPGIPPEVLPKVFEPYFTTKGPRQGTGLGLNIVFRLIKESRGALHVRTEPGKGTAFSIYLPAVPLPVDQPVPAS
jgi:signal transduction histidine kinase